MKRWMKVVVCASVLVVLAAQTNAGVVVFADDFEDDTIGSAPVIGGSNVGDSYGTAAGNVSVVANPTTGSGNESALVLSGADGAINANNIVGHLTDVTSIDGLTISYDFYSVSAKNTNDSVRSSLVGDVDTNRDVFMRNDGDKLIKVDGVDQAQQNFGIGVWQNWTATFTKTSETGDYDLAYALTNLLTSDTVSGTQAITVDLAKFTDGALQGILLEVFEGNAGTNTYIGYVDNVSVTGDIVPEPATLVLLGLGGLVLRRKK